jgi:hypothetical protein
MTSMRYRRVMSRRTMLRGAGTVAIGLPFLDAMHARSVWGAPGDPPVRAFNAFFGLGFPAPLQTEGYAGPLAPMAEVGSKMLVVRGVDQVRADIGGDNAHYDGATTAFNAIPSGGEVQAGGPSLDQVLRRQLYPKGQPTGVIPTLLMGTWFRRSRAGRYIHCWNEDGTPADLPQETPADLFTRIFGEVPPKEDDPEEEKRLRHRRSILDSVIEQYEHTQSDASNLGVASRARIADHLDNLREHEQRVFGEGPNCRTPGMPGGSGIPHGDAADPDGEGIDIALVDLVAEWRLMVDLYTLGVHCDLIRFGGVTFQAAGERIRLTGTYDYDGQTIAEFDDQANLGTGGALGCSHEYWHQFSEGGANTQMRAHIHLMMREITYFLKKLDDPAYADENGGTVLDNALVSISTESGDGRHNDPVRELSGIFHAFSSAGGRLRTGEIVDANAEGIDVYNTIVQQAFGLDYLMGPADRPVAVVDTILP